MEPAPKVPAGTDIFALQQKLKTLTHPKKQMDAILECKDTLRVVRSLPAQDLFALVQQTGISDSLELLALLHPKQVQRFLDMDAWRRDRLDPAALGKWLSALFAANQPTAVRQMRDLDIELLSLMFKLHTKVYDLVKEEQAPEEELKLHSVTPDQHFLICYLIRDDNEALVHALKATIEGFYQRDLAFVLRLIEAIRWELPSALEEEAYRWRTSRLADLGFASDEEIYALFSYVDPDKALATSIKPRGETDTKEEDLGRTSSKVLSESFLLPSDFSGNHIFQKAITALSENDQVRVSHELLMLTNRVHGGLGGDLGDIDSLTASAKVAVDTVSIALTYLSKGNETQLHVPLLLANLPRLFQIGFSLPLRVSRTLKKKIQVTENGLAGRGLLRLDPPLRETIAGMLQKRPQLYVGLLDARATAFRFFESLQEIAQVTAAVNEATFRAFLMGPKGLKFDDACLEKHGEDDISIQPGHSALLSNYLGRILLDQDSKEHYPFSLDDLNALKERMLLKEEKRAFSTQDKEKAEQALLEAIAHMPEAFNSPENQNRVVNYCRIALGALEDELSRINSTSIDLRYIQNIWHEKVSED